jgi:hypothetical protein
MTRSRSRRMSRWTSSSKRRSRSRRRRKEEDLQAWISWYCRVLYVPLPSLTIQRKPSVFTRGWTRLRARLGGNYNREDECIPAAQSVFTSHTSVVHRERVSSNVRRYRRGGVDGCWPAMQPWHNYTNQPCNNTYMPWSTGAEPSY